MEKKTARQRQYEQTKDKLISSLEDIRTTLKLMPLKGLTQNECQKTYILNQISTLESCISGINIDDFTPNEYSGNFKLSYS